MKMKSQTKPQKKAVRFNLFFLEMIIVLLFFGIAAAVILRSFAASDRLVRSSRRLENMAFCAQSAAELYSETGSIGYTAEMLFGSELHALGGADGDVRSLTVPLTDECAYSVQDPRLFMEMAESTEEYAGGKLKTLTVRFEDGDGEALYEITSGAYIHNKGGDGGE